MKDKIDYSFQLSQSVCKELDEISFSLRQNVSKADKENLVLLSEAWESEASVVFGEKYSGFLLNQIDIMKEIEKKKKTIRSISRRLFLIEEAAKQTVAEKGTNS